MTQLNSYTQAAATFAKARKPIAGKPLLAQGWRLFKDGDEYVVYHLSAQVARFLPDNTLRLLVPATGVNRLMPHTIHHALPMRYVRRSAAHYRVHPFVSGSSMEEHESIPDGYRLHDGLTIDLTTRLAPSYREPQIVTDPAARRDWLAKSKALKTYLKTIAKLGGFAARIEAMQADASQKRWTAPSMIHSSPENVETLLAALDHIGLEHLVQRVTEDMFRTSFFTPSVADQIKRVDTIINHHSIALRTALGVITEV